MNPIAEQLPVIKQDLKKPHQFYVDEDIGKRCEEHQNRWVARWQTSDPCYSCVWGKR